METKNQGVVIGKESEQEVITNMFIEKKNLNLKNIINFRKHKGLLRTKGLVWFTAWSSSEQNCHG